MKYIETYQITKDGGMPDESRARFVEFLKKNSGKFVEHSTTTDRKRTSLQNRWFHKVVTIITEFKREIAKDNGDEEYFKISEDRTKLEIKEQYLGWEEVGGQKRLRHTSNLSTLQMNELWEGLQIEYAPQGLYIPNPNEFLERDSRIEEMKDRMKREDEI